MVITKYDRFLDIFESALRGLSSTIINESINNPKNNNVVNILL
jgi:hypothetical protein